MNKQCITDKFPTDMCFWGEDGVCTKHKQVPERKPSPHTFRLNEKNTKDFYKALKKSKKIKSVFIRLALLGEIKKVLKI